MNRKKNKYIIIGPAEPYKGGIAQYTTQLHNALGKYSDVKTVSFKRLYPGFLYRGQTHKISSGDNIPADHRFLIDCYNPLSLSKTINYILKRQPDVVIIAWWTLFWQPALHFIARRLKKRNIKVVLLCHNLYDHSGRSIQKYISKKLLKAADAYIVHSTEQYRQLKLLNSNAQILKRLHPIYNQFPDLVEPVKKRGRLELLFFGLIRPYKGLDTLIAALRRLNDTEVYLTVAGESWGDKTELLNSVASLASNIELNLKYISDDEVPSYFKRADVVVLPYISATGSGVVALAYNYLKPVLATNVGGLRDVVIEGQTGWLIEPNSSEKLAAKISSITREDAAAMAKNIRQFNKENSWDAMAKAILNFSESL